jgi:hypothetical protein
MSGMSVCSCSGCPMGTAIDGASVGGGSPVGTAIGGSIGIYDGCMMRSNCTTIVSNRVCSRQTAGTRTFS